jgi:RHS repeat-associated protein
MVRFVSVQALPKVAKPIYGVETSVFVLQTHNITLCVICQYLFFENGYLFFLFYNITYDTNNNLQSATDATGATTSFTYDANGNITTITDAEGYTTNFAYDLLDRLIQTTNQTGGVFTSEYDPSGNVISQTDALGNTTAFTRDELNRLIKVTNPLNNFTSFLYDTHDRVIRITDEAGAETHYTYDNNGRVITVTDALNNATHIQYDAMGRVRRTTDARNNSTTFTYTPTGLLQTVTDELGGVTTFTYNDAGHLISETNQNGETTHFTRDALGRITSVTNALNHTESFTYDNLGRITTVTDRNGKTTTYEHDANGNITKVTEPSGNISIFEYDKLNRLTSANVNGGQITLYSYDGRGLLTREVNALGDSKIFVYDANGNLISATDEDGYVTTYNYNVLNLIERINHHDGRQATLRYDAAGRLVEVTDWTGQTNFTLDLLGRITAVTDNNNRVVSYTYDAAGNQTNITYPDNTAVTRTFDSLNRLTNIQTAEGLFTYAHDPAGRIKSLAYPNGITETYTHDAIGQLLTIAQGSEILNQYSYDPAGNIISRTENQHNIPGTITQNEFNEMNQLTAQTIHNMRGELTNRFEFTYDLRGNLIQEHDTLNATTQTYHYDAANRMTRGVNHNGEESIYVYNALNILTRRNDTAFVTDYTSFVPTILTEHSTDITTRHIYNGLSRISTTLTATSNPTQAEAFFIQNDCLGTGRFATDTTGTRVAHSLLDEWGNVLSQTQVTFNNTEVNILNTFTNHIFDETLGIYYAQARFYDPSNRRFISPDPHWNAFNRIFGDNPHNNLVPCIYSIRQAGNLYAYVMNNPLRFTDPTGLRNNPSSQTIRAINPLTGKPNVDWNVWGNWSTWPVNPSLVPPLDSPYLYNQPHTQIWLDAHAVMQYYSQFSCRSRQNILSAAANSTTIELAYGALAVGSSSSRGLVSTSVEFVPIKQTHTWNLGTGEHRVWTGASGEAKVELATDRVGARLSGDVGWSSSNLDRQTNSKPVFDGAAGVYVGDISFGPGLSERSSDWVVSIGQSKYVVVGGGLEVRFNLSEFGRQRREN